MIFLVLIFLLTITRNFFQIEVFKLPYGGMTPATQITQLEFEIYNKEGEPITT